MDKMMNPKGFTIIELVVTMAIIAIISTMAFVSFRGVKEKAHDAQRKSDIRQIALALRTYAIDHDDQLPNNGTGEWIGAKDYLEPILAPIYMKTFPEDSLPDWSIYWYWAEADGSVANIWAWLENQKDPQGQGPYYPEYPTYFAIDLP